MEHGEDYGARVRMVRNHARLSQEQLADAIGVERRIIGYIEGNQPRHPLTVEEAKAIARACHVPVRLIISGWDGDANGPASSEPLGPPGALGRDL